MRFAIDIGNTHTVLGVHGGESFLGTWRIHTDPARTADELSALLHFFFSAKGIETDKIRQVIISCVVPTAANAWYHLCKSLALPDPLWISPDIINVPIMYRNPYEVGADRLVNAYAGYARYKTSLVIIDFGTATTFDCISHKGEYLGGAISPGIGIAAEALYSKASKLPRVELNSPPEYSLGKDTQESMKAGILFGYAGLVDGLVQRLKKEMGDPAPTVIATGGLASVMENICTQIDYVEPDLVLDGLCLIGQNMADS